MLDPANAAEQLRGTLPGQAGWFGFSFDLNPLTLGFLVVSPEFAKWYGERFPEYAGIVTEVRGMPEEAAFAEIRRGRWVVGDPEI